MSEHKIVDCVVWARREYRSEIARLAERVQDEEMLRRVWMLLDRRVSAEEQPCRRRINQTNDEYLGYTIDLLFIINNPAEWKKVYYAANDIYEKRFRKWHLR